MDCGRGLSREMRWRLGNLNRSCPENQMGPGMQLKTRQAGYQAKYEWLLIEIITGKERMWRKQYKTISTTKSLAGKSSGNKPRNISTFIPVSLSAML